MQAYNQHTGIQALQTIQGLISARSGNNAETEYRPRKRMTWTEYIARNKTGNEYRARINHGLKPDPGITLGLNLGPRYYKEMNSLRINKSTQINTDTGSGKNRH